MSSVVITLVLPVLIVLALRLFPTRDALKWSWLTLVPDLDYFTWNTGVPGLPNLHRGLLHNAWILFGLTAVLAWRYAKAGGTQPGSSLFAYLQTRRGALWGLSVYYYFAHLALDLFAGGVSLLWPLTTWTLAYDFRILVDTSTNQPTLDQGASTSSTIPNVSPLFEWLSNEESAIIFLLLASLVLLWVRRRSNPDVEFVTAREIGPGGVRSYERR